MTPVIFHLKKIMTPVDPAKKSQKSAEILEICKLDDFESIISVKRVENG